MAMTLAELRRLQQGGAPADLEGLSGDERASIRAELQAEQDARVSAEARAAEKTHASAERQRGLNEQVGPRQPRPIRSAETGAFSGPVEGMDPAAREAAAAQRVSDAEQAKGLDRSARTQYQEPTVEAQSAAARDRARGPGSEATTRRASVGGTGFTESQLPDLESKPGVIERGLRAVGATGAADTREAARVGAREELIEGDAEARKRPAGGELDVEDRPLSGAQQKKVDSLNKNIATAQERKRRAQQTINRSKNPAAIKAAKEAIKAADKDIAGANTRAATVQAEARTPTPVTDAVERAKRTAKQPAAVSDEVVNKAKGVLDDTISKVDEVTKGPLEKGKNIFNKAIDKSKAAFAGLKGGGTAAASASVDAGVDEMTKDMPDGPGKNRAVRALSTLGKAGGVVGLVDMAGSYLRNVYENDFGTANVDLIEGITQLIEAGGETVEAVRTGEMGMDEVVVELARGLVEGITGVIPSLIDNGQFFAGEALDAAFGLPGAEVATSPTGLRGTGVGEPTSQEFTGPADPGELPGRPGERFDPTGTQPAVSVETDPFITPGAREGEFDVGLRGGQGTIDASRAVGGASGFAQRVEESRRAGAYDPVSQERRDEAERDLGRIKRGTTAIRDLAATRLGVPTQYLDAVRSGSMTPREANLAQAKQAATGNLGGMSAAEAQQFQIRAQQEGRAATEFRQGMDDTARTRFNDTGTEVADTFPDSSPEEKADIASGFTSFAAGWLPEGQDPSQLSPGDLQVVKGQYILATSLAKQGEGWFRALLPWKADITANTLFSKGENILQSMERQGEWFDIGNDNLQFRGRDSAGESVTLTVEPEKLPPVAQQMINQARATISPRRGLNN
jgi:hypothetical protein